jgi:hypothetical protein
MAENPAAGIRLWRHNHQKHRKTEIIKYEKEHK